MDTNTRIVLELVFAAKTMHARRWHLNGKSFTMTRYCCCQGPSGYPWVWNIAEYLRCKDCVWVVCTFPFNLGLTLAETQVTQVKEVKEVRDAQVSAVPALDFSAGIEGTTFRRHLIGINLYEICSFVALNWSRVSRESTFRLVNEIAIPVTHPCSTRVVVQMIETFRRCGQNHHVQTRF